MNPTTTMNDALRAVADLTQKLGAIKFVLAFLATMSLAYLINHLVDKIVPRIAAKLTSHADRTSKADQLLQLRRAETFLSVALAVFKTFVVLAALFIAYKVTNPTTAPLAVVSASAFIIVIIGSTAGPLLRDIITGVIMIVEQWYNIGDHIAVEPFMGVSGIVEEITLRSTKLRSLTGEIIWVHNQYIQGVRVTPQGVRTIALDVFVTDLEQGTHIVEQIINTLPKGATMVARKLVIRETEKLSDTLWRIMAVGQTTPGREWLIEDFAVSAMIKNDAESDFGPVIAHGPIVHYADATAERRFKRAIRAKTN